MSVRRHLVSTQDAYTVLVAKPWDMGMILLSIRRNPADLSRMAQARIQPDRNPGL